MAVRTCCVESCKSCSTRKEDHRVTFHKFPKDARLLQIWISVTHYNVKDCPAYVCSRHFRKSDFQTYKDSKYVLKTDAIPSIFPWLTTNKKKMENSETSEPPAMESDSLNKSQATESTHRVSTSSKESEENVDAIKKFIEEQDREIMQKSAEEQLKNIETAYNDNEIKDFQETAPVSIGVMDMILNESEASTSYKKDYDKDDAKHSFSSGSKGYASMALSVGSRVEARDFSEEWHSAQISEVDYEEMEVLVHYNHDSKRYDEWISVSSPRLRPAGSKPTPQPSTSTEDKIPEPTDIVKEDKDVKVEKPEDKPKMLFSVGERCLARWRDNRRFTATINNDLGNGNYEIIFDDGFLWTCNTTRLHKWKPTGRSELTVDTSLHSPTASTLSPILSGGPSNSNLQPGQQIAYHTHLFDPARDYLSSKSERREMKRKLNIKEIFNIGQKRQKIQKPVKLTPKVVAKKPIVEKKGEKNTPKVKVGVKKEIKSEVKPDIPDAVASIIGTVASVESLIPEVKLERLPEPKPEIEDKPKIEDDDITDASTSFDDSLETTDTTRDPEQEVKNYADPVLDEEVKLEKFDKQDDTKHEQVIDRIKEVISKLEGGINSAERTSSPKPEIKEEIPPTPTLETTEIVVPEEKPETKPADVDVTPAEKGKKKLSKMKKGKKLRLLQEKKVKKQVEKVKSELEEMKRQVEEMRKEMLQKTQRLAAGGAGGGGGGEGMPDSFLLPGEWCCRWVDGQPLGAVCELQDARAGLPRRSVQVEDKRLPPGWSKHLVRRSVGNSAGKWDVVLVSPENRRFHMKADMRNYLDNNPDESLKPYEHALLDFGVHLKLSRRMGWITKTPGGEAAAPTVTLPAGTLDTTSPLVKRKPLSLKRGMKVKDKKKRLTLKLKVPRPSQTVSSHLYIGKSDPGISGVADTALETPQLEDGYVYVGSLKVQLIDNLLRCPAEGCFKNFRNNTLLQMHIKHYHRELRKMLGATPKVLDLAYARTVPVESETPRQGDRVIKVKLKLPKREEPKPELKDPETHIDLRPSTPVHHDDNIPKVQDSPKLRDALSSKPVKRPRVLLPVRRPDPETQSTQAAIEDFEHKDFSESSIELPAPEPLDFETAISTHTVTKPASETRRKGDKKLKYFAVMSQKQSEDDEWFEPNSDFETRSSFPRSGTPDSKIFDGKIANPVSSESNEDQKESHMYTYTENGERIKIVHMKREEIINCHCGVREEDGLMVQCELCLCWQHALCHNIQSEAQVPEKYTCSICLSPRRGRRARRFVHDQDRLYEGLLPGARACPALRRQHELAGNLLRMDDALQALRIKYYVATKKNHPKLYLWAKDWEQCEIAYTQEKLNSDYSDLNIMINNLDKENLQAKDDDMSDMPLDISTPLSEEQEQDRYSQGSGSLGCLGAPLQLPITTSELERLAQSVQEACPTVSAPQPEAAIDDGVCRARLLRHVQRCHALLDARLDSIEAQVAELESQDPSFEDDDTADNFPRTKQTVQMLMRDLDNMEELGIIT